MHDSWQDRGRDRSRVGAVRGRRGVSGLLRRGCSSRSARSGSWISANVVGYGIPPKPDFWLGPRATGTGFRETHLAFLAPDREAVREFFRVAVESGAEVLHEPRVWPEYHPTYYGAFVRDPDGNNVEAVCHTPE